MQGLAGILDRAVALMPPLQSLVVAIVYCVGLVCAISALRGFAAVNDQRLAPRGWSQAGWQGPTFLLILALAFVSLSQVISACLMTLFGMDQTYAASEVFAYAPQLLKPAQSDMGRRLLVSIVRILQFIGLLAFIRGLYVANLSALFPYRRLLSKGLTHMTGGICAMNMPAFLQLIQMLLLGE
ncbi:MULTISPECIES: hypothetical protein [Ochrobactrum]|uniref:Uncharacterized protein n=1 Tax=Ochrobactrum quorumnocens TaxID=271865 RepID=A0A5N1JWD7_9HYPH|nr:MULTISPECIES: hypothetical protein [Brucella/Ochrobactrum group]KAA9368336.1 hypothetical protein F3W84_10635 [[Ochrobactrum] quorumnocens]MBD7991758.1 hypothetical protein [Ochrobactrum gallinarum]MDH7792544.1 hypothetical protein [Ochrobactrum sp. AN78]